MQRQRLGNYLECPFGRLDFPHDKDVSTCHQLPRSMTQPLDLQYVLVKRP